MVFIPAEKEHSSGESKDSVATLVKEKDQVLYFLGTTGNRLCHKCMLQNAIITFSVC